MLMEEKINLKKLQKKHFQLLIGSSSVKPTTKTQPYQWVSFFFGPE